MTARHRDGLADERLEGPPDGWPLEASGGPVPGTPCCSRTADGPIAADGHGRPLTTGPAAAACYRRAVEVLPTGVAAATAHLARAVALDPSFQVARADLTALGGAVADRADGEDARAAEPIRLHRWERHHLDVVRAATTGRVDVAVALLGEHHRSDGCDPLALAIVLDAVIGRGAPERRLTRLARSLPSCGGLPPRAPAE